MTKMTYSRNATIDEMAAEIDRRGAVIEKLEARLRCIDGIYPGAIDNLNHHQRQLDCDGIEVAVSRQALSEVLLGVNASLENPPHGGTMTDERMNACIVSNDDDWEGLYLNGKLVVEGHSVSARQVLCALRALMLVNYEDRICDSDWLAEKGNLPENLEQVKWPQ